MLAAGVRASGRRLVVYALPSGARLRGGLVCGKAIGGAVARNHARRMLREAWRAVLRHGAQGYDVVVLARPEIGGATTQELVRDLGPSLRAVGVLLP